MNGSINNRSINHHHIGDGKASFHLKLVLFLAFVCAGVLASAAQPTKQVSIIKSSEAAVYDTVIEVLDQQLQRPCNAQEHSCLRVETHSFTAGEAPFPNPSDDLVLTLGLKAREYADQYLGNSRIINAMIPTANGQLSESAINSLKHPTLLLDQPPIRSLLLIKFLIPTAERIGLLISRDDTKRMASLVRAADKLDLQLVIRIVDNEDNLGKQLATMLDEIDVLLALPDNKIHNRHNVSSILLTTYRNRIPLIGFSAAYVKAGALAAVYSTPENIGDQLADLIVQVFTSQGPEKRVIYPNYFSVSINSRVARSLGIQLQLDSDKLEQLIRDAEQ